MEFALGATRVGNRPKERKKRFERLQGGLRMIRSPHTDSDFFRPRNPPTPVAPQNVESCWIWDSVQCVEQPWRYPGGETGLRRTSRQRTRALAFARDRRFGRHRCLANQRMAPFLIRWRLRQAVVDCSVGGRSRL